MGHYTSVLDKAQLTIRQVFAWQMPLLGLEQSCCAARTANKRQNGARSLDRQRKFDVWLNVKSSLHAVAHTFEFLEGVRNGTAFCLNVIFRSRVQDLKTATPSSRMLSRSRQLAPSQEWSRHSVSRLWNSSDTHMRTSFGLPWSTFSVSAGWAAMKNKTKSRRRTERKMSVSNILRWCFPNEPAILRISSDYYRDAIESIRF